MAVTVKMLIIETAWPVSDGLVLPEGWYPLSLPDVTEVNENKIAKARIWVWRES